MYFVNNTPEQATKKLEKLMTQHEPVGFSWQLDKLSRISLSNRTRLMSLKTPLEIGESDYLLTKGKQTTSMLRSSRSALQSF